jgi:hypothetical protein
MVVNLHLKRVKEFVYGNIHPQTKKEIEVAEKEIQDFNYNINNNTIALLENFDFHGECLPSYVKYFLDLKYEVHLFVSKKQINDNMFVNCNFDSDKFKIYAFSKFPTNDTFFKLLEKYKIVFLSSLLCRDNIYFSDILLKKYKKNNLFCVNHETYLLKDNKDLEDKILTKTFVLRDNIKHLDFNYPYISTIYFGEFGNTLKDKNNSVIFTCFTRNAQKNIRNYKMLFSAVDKLLAENISNFKIQFTGLKKDDVIEFINETNASKFEFLGKLSYKQLYETMLQTDFVLFNIDYTTSDYQKYLKKGITGSYSLSIGFNRPPIIDSDLADAYHLSEMSFLYDKDKLFYALSDAILCTNSEYRNKQNNILKLNKKLSSESISNIRSLFDYVS